MNPCGIAFISAAFLASASSAYAAAVTDVATGFAVDPPPAFVAERLDVPDYDVAFSIHAQDDIAPADSGDFPCIVGFLRAPRASSLPQEAINAAMLSPERQQLLAGSIEAAYTILEQDVFDSNGRAGTEFIVEPPADPSARVYLAWFETKLGRTVLTCGTTAERSDADIENYRQIRDTITPPIR